MLRVFNTLTRRKEEFDPIEPGVVKIYTCGLTVYAPMHVGHARTYCFWDLLRRYFEYRGLHVQSVVNYTDVDDRIIQAARESGQTWNQVSEANIARFREDCRALRIRDYSAYTRATDFIARQIAMVKQLIEKGFAYVVDGEVFYEVQRFANYGKLSGKVVEDLISGASGRVSEDTSRKRHPADFTLWKPSKEGEPCWQTGQPEWPDGRPGWHIECSAMGTGLLGSPIDIHGGAVDNLFPHHENEVAQSEPLCGEPWVKYWMHPEHLDMNAVKMSKSLGNVVSVPEVLERHGVENLRWFFSTQHYRTKISYSDELIEHASEGFKRVRRLISLLEDRLGAAPDELQVPAGGTYATLRPEEQRWPRYRHEYEHGAFAPFTTTFLAKFATAMNDDLNTPRATAAIFDYVAELYGNGIENAEDEVSLLAVYRCLTRHLSVFGIDIIHATLHPSLASEFSIGGEDAGKPFERVLDTFVELRAQARAAKDFAKSDLIRDMLQAAGVTLQDGPRGARWSLK